ncbi:MAG: hypothetical protein Q9217_002513 [Psora testacea]
MYEGRGITHTAYRSNPISAPTRRLGLREQGPQLSLDDWSMEVYSLENAIRSFFAGKVSPSQKECDDLAHSLLGGERVVPFPIQGQFSYTVFSPQAVIDVPPDGDGNSQPITNAKIVQFRLNNSKIDIYVAQLAKAIHGDIAAETDYCGEIGQEAGACLDVYIIQKLPGVTYIEMGNFSVEMNPEQASKQLRLIEDLARYGNQDLYVICCELFELTPLELLELGEIFHPRYPQVLTHGDLCPMNILVSPTTGRVTGIIDWAEAEVLPFGLALYGLENLLGYMGPGGWNYFEIWDELEQKFWNQFWDCITNAKAPPEDRIRHSVTIARQVGVLMQYGFKWENGTVERAVTEKDAGSLAYLDAFLLTDERHITGEKMKNGTSYAPDSVF